MTGLVSRDDPAMELPIEYEDIRALMVGVMRANGKLDDIIVLLGGEDEEEEEE